MQKSLFILFLISFNIVSGKLEDWYQEDTGNPTTLIEACNAENIALSRKGKQLAKEFSEDPSQFQVPKFVNQKLFQAFLVIQDEFNAVEVAANALELNEHLNAYERAVIKKLGQLASHFKLAGSKSHDYLKSILYWHPYFMIHKEVYHPFTGFVKAHVSSSKLGCNEKEFFECTAMLQKHMWGDFFKEAAHKAVLRIFERAAKGQLFFDHPKELKAVFTVSSSDKKYVSTLCSTHKDKIESLNYYLEGLGIKVATSPKNVEARAQLKTTLERMSTQLKENPLLQQAFSENLGNWGHNQDSTDLFYEMRERLIMLKDLSESPELSRFFHGANAGILIGLQETGALIPTGILRKMGVTICSGELREGATDVGVNTAYISGGDRSNTGIEMAIGYAKDKRFVMTLDINFQSLVDETFQDKESYQCQVLRGFLEADDLSSIESCKQFSRVFCTRSPFRTSITSVLASHLLPKLKALDIKINRSKSLGYWQNDEARHILVDNLNKTQVFLDKLIGYPWFKDFIEKDRCPLENNISNIEVVYNALKSEVERALSAAQKEVPLFTEQKKAILKNPFPIVFSTNYISGRMGTLDKIGELVFPGAMDLREDIKAVFVPKENIKFMQTWISETLALENPLAVQDIAILEASVAESKFDRKHLLHLITS
jgi:hypothetical protein